jgi:hypothetical protein
VFQVTRHPGDRPRVQDAQADAVPQEGRPGGPVEPVGDGPVRVAGDLAAEAEVDRPAATVGVERQSEAVGPAVDGEVRDGHREGVPVPAVADGRVDGLQYLGRPGPDVPQPAGGRVEGGGQPAGPVLLVAHGTGSC